jgi:hypothetical protein
MEFIDSPTEQTTAIIDLILAALSLSSALYLRRYAATVSPILGR